MKLADSLRRPDKEYLDRRDAVFARMDEEISIKRDGMDMEVEIPDLDLSFIDEMQENKRSTCSFTIELSDEVSRLLLISLRIRLTAFDRAAKLQNGETIWDIFIL